MVLVAVLFCARAEALIVSSNEADLSVLLDDPANVATYSSFPYWDNVGWRGEQTWGTDGTAIYL